MRMPPIIKEIRHWLPVQRCLECNAPFWAGLPRVWVYPKIDQCGGKSLWLGVTWCPAWQDHCSRACADADMKRVDACYSGPFVIDSTGATIKLDVHLPPGVYHCGPDAWATLQPKGIDLGPVEFKSTPRK